MDAELAVERLRALIRIPTVSRMAPELADEAAFVEFRAELARLYPLVSGLRPEVVGGGSLLFRWPGHDPGAEPAVFMAHYDVVPADDVPDQTGGWTHPPFDAEVTGEGP